MPRDLMPDALRVISDWLPLSYAIDAVTAVRAVRAAGGCGGRCPT